MTDSLVGLSQRIPVAAVELAKVAEVAGRLGITGKQAILDFVEPVALLGQVTGTSAEEVATGLGKLILLTGESTAAVAPLAHLFLDLADSSTASVPELLQAAQAIARSGSAFHASAAEAGAMASMVAQLTDRVQFAGQAIGSVMDTMKNAINGGGVAMEGWLSLTGQTQQQLAALIKSSPIDAFELLLDSLHRLSSAGGDATQEMRLLGLGSEQILRILPALALHSDQFAAAIEHARAGMTDFSKMQAPDTLSNELKILANDFDNLALKMVGQGGVLSDFKNMLRSMEEALAGDNIGLAAQIFWATLKLEWEKGSAFITNEWHQFEPMLVEFGKRIIETLGVVGANAGAAMWAGIKNSYAAYAENEKHENSLKTIRGDYNAQILDAIHDPAKAASLRDTMHSVLASEEKLHTEALQKLTGSFDIGKNVADELGAVWGSPLPAANVPAGFTPAQSAAIAAAQAERDRLVALATSQPTTQSAGTPTPMSGYQAVTSWSGLPAGVTWPSGSGTFPNAGTAAPTAQAANAYGDAINKVIQSMRDESRALSVLEPQRARETALIAAEANADTVLTHGTEQWTAAVDASMTAFDQLQKLKGAAEMDTYLKDLQKEKDLLFLTDDERERTVKLQEAEKMLQEHGYTGAELQGQLSNYNEALKSFEQTKKAAEMLKSVASDVATDFGNCFESIVFGTKTVAQAFESLAVDIEHTLIHDIITVNLVKGIEGGLMSLFGGAALFAANGRVFDQGNVMPFAAGGVVNSPTLFRFAGGAGLMGEAGPEAIMPLRRGSDGRLGVQGGGVTVPVTVNVINQSSHPVAAEIRARPV